MPATPVVSIASGVDAEFRKRIDRLGYLDNRYREFQPKIKERDALKKRFQDECKQPADQPERLVGNLYYLDLTPRENQRKVTHKEKAFAALKKAMGMEKLVTALSFTLKLIDQYIPAQNQIAFVTEERTGSRDVSAVLIDAPKAA